jgi:hypothetical protein
MKMERAPYTLGDEPRLMVRTEARQGTVAARSIEYLQTCLEKLALFSRGRERLFAIPRQIAQK